VPWAGEWRGVAWASHLDVLKGHARGIVLVEEGQISEGVPQAVERVLVAPHDLVGTDHGLIPPHARDEEVDADLLAPAIFLRGRRGAWAGQRSGRRPGVRAPGPARNCCAAWVGFRCLTRMSRDSIQTRVKTGRLRYVHSPW